MVTITVLIAVQDWSGMSDLIERQKALDAIQQRADGIDSVYSAFWEGLIIAQDIVKNIPSAEQEERTAKVVNVSEGFYSAHGVCMCGHCDQCGNAVCDDFHWCPFCGARLEWR